MQWPGDPSLGRLNGTVFDHHGAHSGTGFARVPGKCIAWAGALAVSTCERGRAHRRRICLVTNGAGSAASRVCQRGAMWLCIVSIGRKLEAARQIAGLNADLIRRRYVPLNKKLGLWVSMFAAANSSRQSAREASRRRCRLERAVRRPPRNETTWRGKTSRATQPEVYCRRSNGGPRFPSCRLSFLLNSKPERRGQSNDTLPDSTREGVCGSRATLFLRHHLRSAGQRL